MRFVKPTRLGVEDAGYVEDPSGSEPALVLRQGEQFGPGFRDAAVFRGGVQPGHPVVVQGELA